jgi:uncharacterized SAM-binding protein YcdF (DUF218 family)
VFFYLAKVLWFLAQPSNLITIAIGVGLFLTATKWRIAGRRLTSAGVVALLIGGLSPVAGMLILPLENRFPRPDLTRDSRPIRGIIVLGGAEDVRYRPPRELASVNEAAERYIEAVALARRFPEAQIVFSGGSGSLFSEAGPEADTAARLFAALGIDASRITFEGRSRDTYENAMFTARLIGTSPRQEGRWVLITSGWHMPRAIGCFRRAGLMVEAWPVDYRTSGRFEALDWEDSISKGLRRLDFIAKEYVGLLAYYVTGRTSALLPAP